MDILSRRIRDLRIDHDLKQNEMGEVLGISQNMVSNYENGREPPLDVLFQYAEHFDVSIEYLLGFTVEKRPAKEAFAEHLNRLATLTEKRGIEPLPISSFISLAEKLYGYFEAGAPSAGNAPIEAVRGYLAGMCNLLDALQTGSTAAIVAAVNEVSVQQISVMDVLTEYLKARDQ